MPPFRLALAVILAALAGGAGAQEVTLPSGLAATLYDVVLEPAGAATGAPDAFTDPEAGPEAAAEGDLGDEPLDRAPAAAGPDAPAGAGGLARFRLLVPGLGEAGFDRVAGDFAWACEALALPALAANGWRAGEVVIALSDREVAFGTVDPEAVQFFEGFRVEAGACVPQAF